MSKRKKAWIKFTLTMIVIMVMKRLFFGKGSRHTVRIGDYGDCGC